MKIKDLFANDAFFSKTEEKAIVKAIKQAEKLSSGEIRVHVDKHYADDIETAAMQVFEKLKMYNTQDLNGVLIYINVPAHKFYLIGDEGIHAKVGANFWSQVSQSIATSFKTGSFAQGTIDGVLEIGKQLKSYFPYQGNADKNELDDNISYD